MIDNSYDAVCIADGSSRMLLLNRAFEKVMGLAIKDLIGKRILDLLALGLTDTAATVKVLETGRQATVTINTRAGRQVLSTGVPVYGDDQKIHRIFCNLRDVTDLVHLREQYNASQCLASRYLMELQEFKSSEAMRSRIMTRNKTMQQLIDLVLRMGQVESSLLISGESGVGKDLLAKMVHEASPRAETGSLVKVSCASIPESLLESELFGYEAGAFTGARTGGKVGYFEIADKGTLFLDEIGDLPLALQIKLLTVLQDRTVVRVGGTDPIPIDIRIVAATNRDLEGLVHDGRFREDLYYRLNVVPIKVPPLRERSNDIPFLVAHFLGRFNHKYKRNLLLAKDSIEALCQYQWPGNVRELENLIERLVVTTQREVMELDHLPPHYTNKCQGRMYKSSDFPSLKTAVHDLENDLVIQAVAMCRSREEAASRLGLSLSSLTRRLRRAQGRS
ncbi:MAG: sigma 54-interacting transcriptional regulator [Proteobacteria bacterium]|nr:sigma 54-interacting transcriptional regulator [Pseudomonadota bacterium]MBU1740701.1 sigma 54-interacting transcriptional regulator [Pseudomonadota bacterium]